MVLSTHDANYLILGSTWICIIHFHGEIPVKWSHFLNIEHQSSWEVSIPVYHMKKAYLFPPQMINMVKFSFLMPLSIFLHYGIYMNIRTSCWRERFLLYFIFYMHLIPSYFWVSGLGFYFFRERPEKGYGLVISSFIDLTVPCMRLPEK